jgi:hypothetical protein
MILRDIQEVMGRRKFPNPLTGVELLTLPSSTPQFNHRSLHPDVSWILYLMKVRSQSCWLDVNKINLNSKVLYHLVLLSIRVGKIYSKETYTKEDEN